MSRPLISVVMPAHNSAATVGAAVSSVLWQTHDPLELLVVDDGSSDATADIVRGFRDPRVRLIQQGWAGQAAARNAAMAQASGDLIAFFDSDDLMFDQYLEALYSTWRTGARGIATSNAYWLLPGGIMSRRLRHTGRFPAPARQRLALLENNFVSIMSLFPAVMVETIGTMDTDLRYAEDWEFWLRAVFAGYVVEHQPWPMALFRWGNASVSAHREPVYEAETEILRRMAARPGLSVAETSYLRRRLAAPPPRKLLASAEGAIRTGRYAEASRLYAEAADLCRSQTRLVAAARVMRCAPWLAGPLLRRRMLRREQSVGFDQSFVR
jgi:glycosyltransferase involved in cell wall biosynthesis